jgi:hypothetical protein
MSGDLATACQPLALRTFRGKIRGRGVVNRLLRCFRLALLAARPDRGGGVTARHPDPGMISGLTIQKVSHHTVPTIYQCFASATAFYSTYRSQVEFGFSIFFLFVDPYPEFTITLQTDCNCLLYLSLYDFSKIWKRDLF